MPQVWTIGCSKDGYVLTLAKTPLWALLVEDATDRLCATVGHIGCNPPEWTFRVPLSPHRDSDGDWERSLGSGLHDLFSKLSNIQYRREQEVTSLPVSNETARSIDPDFYEHTAFLRELEDLEEPFGVEFYDDHPGPGPAPDATRLRELTTQAGWPAELWD